MASPKFEIYEGKNGEFYFRFKAGNGEIILSSEGYKAEAGAKNGVESVRKNGTDPERYDIREAKNEKSYFVLKAGNNQVIGNSQMYASEAGAEKGVEACVRNVTLYNLEN